MSDYVEDADASGKRTDNTRSAADFTSEISERMMPSKRRPREQKATQRVQRAEGAGTPRAVHQIETSEILCSRPRRRVPQPASSACCCAWPRRHPFFRAPFRPGSATFASDFQQGRNGERLESISVQWFASRASLETTRSSKTSMAATVD